jgi:hypothetical protein
LPRLSALKLSPDGKRLVVAVSRPGPEGKKMKTALWQVDPAGGRSRGGSRARRRASRSAVSCATDRCSSPRPGRTRTPSRTRTRRSTPSGCSRPAAARRGCCSRRTAASTGGGRPRRRRIVFGTALHPDATDLADDAERAKARKDAGVGALLFDSTRSATGTSGWPRAAGGSSPPAPRAAADADPEARLDPRDLTGDAGPPRWSSRAIDISPDGKTVYTRWATTRARR